MSELYHNWLEVVRNIRRARHKWVRLAQVLGIEVAGYRTLGRFYIEVFQAVLLYESNIWVVTPCIGSNL